MDRKQFEMRYNFIPVFDTIRKKRVSLAPHLANDKEYLARHGFIVIEAPLSPIIELPIIEVIEEKPKRGRPKKQK